MGQYNNLLNCCTKKLKCLSFKQLCFLSQDLGATSTICDPHKCPFSSSSFASYIQYKELSHFFEDTNNPSKWFLMLLLYTNLYLLICMWFQFLGCTILMGRAVLKLVFVFFISPSITLVQYSLMHVLEWENK